MREHVNSSVSSRVFQQSFTEILGSRKGESCCFVFLGHESLPSRGLMNASWYLLDFAVHFLLNVVAKLSGNTTCGTLSLCSNTPFNSPLLLAIPCKHMPDWGFIFALSRCLHLISGRSCASPCHGKHLIKESMGTPKPIFTKTRTPCWPSIPTIWISVVNPIPMEILVIVLF